MGPRPQSKRAVAEDSDTESEHDVDVAGEDAMRRLMEIDLGTYRAGQLKQDDRRPKGEDRANVRHLLESRDACQEGTEAYSLYTKNKSATAAWNNPNNVIDNHEERFDPLDNGNAHRQRMRNLHGGRVEEPTEWDAGYGGGGRGRGGFASRGGRGGIASAPSRAPASSRAPAPAGPRAGIARPSPYPARSTTTQPANYRPLDPALQDANDPQSKYGKAARGGALVGRGGGNAGRSSSRADRKVHSASVSQPSTARMNQPGGGREHHINMLADPAAFMRAVSGMKNKTKAETKLATEPEAAKPIKVTQKASSTTIESKWGDFGSEISPHLPKTSTKTTVQSTTALSAANIRQVPTSEFAFPPPHRGETDSWTDGLPSVHPSDSVSLTFSGTAAEQSPAVGRGDLVGLGIKDAETSRRNAPNRGNTANGVNLMDVVNEDLTVLQEPPKPRAALSKRIFVNGAWYVLDESALGNASSTEVVDTSPASALTYQGELTSSTNHHKDVMAKKPMSTTSTPSSIIGNRKVSVGVQNTPSLNSSQWASASRAQESNPFAAGTAPPRASVAHGQSTGEFTAYVGGQSNEVMSAILFTELTSSEVESVASTPNLTSYIWGRPHAQVVKSPQVVPSPQFDSSSTSTTRAPTVVGRSPFPGSTFNTSWPLPAAVIDSYDLVRLQAVGNAAFGMTPFRPTLVTPGESTPDATTRPTHARQESIATSISSDATASSGRGRGLTASKYASGDTTSEHLGLGALQGLSLNSSAPRGGNAAPKPPSSRFTFDTASNGPRYATFNDENTPPHQATSTSSSGNRPILRPIARIPITSPARGRGYQPISATRREAGPGFGVLQADIAATVNAANVPAPRPTGVLFPSTKLAKKVGAKVSDDGYESDL